ncbi:zinc-binding dehydrogenase [Ilumatobacter sp.]|uniref:zinc-binding dehydrogenase n=1 Tax=Ilumatobacter sp. TaxID=1967498 RepID=UPI003B524FE2
MRALQVRRSVGRFGAARIVGAVSPAGATRVGPLEHRTIDDPERPGDEWHRVTTRLSGICGSDLSMVGGHASTYFEDWVSFPFVPGHEVVGDLDDGTRVVLEPVLGHAARGVALPFEGARPADGDDHAHLAITSPDGIEPAIQTGFCCSTGGGWAPWFWAHESQLHRLDATVEDFPDERAVLIEPFAGGIHAALLAAGSATGPSTPVVAVIGAGTMGLAAIAGLRRHAPGTRIVVGARYAHQRALALSMGADVAVADAEIDRAVRREVGCHMIGGGRSGALTSGAHATIDAVGSGASIATGLRITRPGGRLVLLGMPSEVTIDLTGLWHREIELKGAYTYGTETLADGSVTDTFTLATQTVEAVGAERLVSAVYPLADHADAIAHAANAGRRGAVKIAFDPRTAP